MKTFREFVELKEGYAPKPVLDKLRKLVKPVSSSSGRGATALKISIERTDDVMQALTKEFGKPVAETDHYVWYWDNVRISIGNSTQDELRKVGFTHRPVNVRTID